MIVYQSTKSGFLNDILSNNISDIIHTAYYERLGRHTSQNEVNSWTNSMLYMNNILSDPKIPDNAGISIEFQIPLTSKRIDFIITGLDDFKNEQVIIIELKQWSKAQLTDKDAIVITRFQHGDSETAHPSYQAWSYASMIYNFNSTVQDEKITLKPCAYLHNYNPDNVITNKLYKYYIEKAPVFLKPDAIKLRDFIKNHIKYGDNKDILYKIENGRIRPSKQLVDSLSSMLLGNTEFIMIDDQKVVFEKALSIAKKLKTDKKYVLIVEGGPGTGKSVVAINLLVNLYKYDLVTKYVSKNSAPREVYSTKLSGIKTKTEISNLFGGTGSFIDVEPNTFDVLLVDEAHRLNLKSGLYQNLGDNQIEEIINASRFSVFFVDDDQQIHIKDVGSCKYIETVAKMNGAVVSKLKLESQFRCNGSDGFLSWLDNTLQIKETANIKLSSNEFDFKVFSDLNELRRIIFEKNQINNKSRLVAGYCWDWISSKDNTKTDINFPEFNFGMKWNLKKDGSKWIIGDDSVNEIGCIHTCQGLELDYVGVIIGNDLRVENNCIITDVLKRSSNDKSVTGIKKLLKENKAKALDIADKIIKNTYRTLMTRGMKGCYVYCCDNNLSDYIQSRIEENSLNLNFEENKEKVTIRIEPLVNDDVKYIDFLPLYSLKAACGAFGEWQTVNEDGWVKVEGIGRLNRNMFVVKAIGKSMEPLISDNDLCVFKANVVGSRNNKIVLVQHNNYIDSENQGSYSIKKYTSEKFFDKETGEWQHEKIILKPLNVNYKPIIIEEDDGYLVVAEFVSVIKI
ncbi:MAG: DNA/RNA helicase domain-containing protein [Bacteroidales bacterium]